MYIAKIMDEEIVIAKSDEEFEPERVKRVCDCLDYHFGGAKFHDILKNIRQEWLKNNIEIIIRRKGD